MPSFSNLKHLKIHQVLMHDEMKPLLETNCIEMIGITFQLSYNRLYLRWLIQIYQSLTLYITGKVSLQRLRPIHARQCPLPATKPNIFELKHCGGASRIDLPCSTSTSSASTANLLPHGFSEQRPILNCVGIRGVRCIRPFSGARENHLPAKSEQGRSVHRHCDLC